MNCVVTRKELKAILNFASTEPNRYVLNGCQIEVWKKNGAPILIATDGRMIGVIKSECPLDVETKTGILTLRNDTVKSIVACCPKAQTFRIISDEKSIHIKPEGLGSAEIEMKTENYFSTTGLHYPNWRHVLPGNQTRNTRIAQSRVTLDAGLLSQAYKAFNDLGLGHRTESRGLEIGIINDSSMLIPRFTSKSNLWIGLMPMRNDSVSELFLPTFLEGEPTPVAPAEPKPEEKPATP